MMDGDVFGVRIVPPLIEYRDTEIGETHKINVTVKNVSKTSKEIRYYGPQTHFFNLKVKNPEERVAAGLEVTATVEYKVTDTDQHQDRLVVTVDGDVIEVPLKGYPCLPDLQLKGPVNFGNVVANSKVISTDIPLINHGSKEGEFKIKYTGNKPIAIIPSSGRVPPSSVQMIKVEYVTKQPGMFSETAKVKLEGHDTSLLQITGKVVDGTLELLSHSKEEAINCVEFGSTYYGTDQTECAMLYNNGPESLFFVAVLDEEASGQEVGVDLTKSTAATLASQKTDNSSKGQINELSSLVTAIPNQGMLAPYEKIPIFFRFSPRWSAGQQGFKCTQEAPPRQDFALFMHIKVVGASHGFQDDDQPQEKSNVEGSSLEVALVGTALPVLMKLTPQSRYDFGECPVGEHVDSLCMLSNTSTDIPINFNFRRVAHFTARPTSGKIKPGDSQDIIFSFTPNQVGTFKPTQYVDVIGMVADNRNPFLMCPETIHSLPLSFLGKSDPLSVKKQPVFNPGITPKIANEVGLYVDTTVATGDKNPRVAMHNAKGTKIHRHKTSKERRNMGDKALIAFPNDRAKSVRPSDRRENYTTIFTREERYTYVDPDYAYTDAEANLIQKHKEQYLNYIAELRENRINKDRRSEFEETNNSVDIAIKPAAGLRPKKLLLEEVGPDQRAPTPPNAAFKMLTAKELAKAETLASQNSKDGLNAVPTTNKEKTDCKKILSPQELHQVIIGPPTIDFGSVCLKSVSQKELNIVNNLNTHIHVVVHVDCRELRQTSPLSQVVPPNSKANLPLIFETNTRGRFQRSLDYTINGFYKSHITVFAEVVPVALHMSTYELTLEPQIGLPADAGVRGIITLSNKLNHPADFTWNPLLGERGTAFSIRPATGTVEAFQELDCEVVFHPSYMAPEDGEFALQVHGGNSMSLKCNAKLGQTNVSFVDRRVMFGQLPLHLTTTRTAMLKNNSLNHAYFQVMDPNPFPGLTVDPIFGVVPVGGTTELKIHLTPNAVIKFDTRVNVAIRGWKMLELRMGGTVEPPCVDIDLHSFNLGGVFCGSQKTIPFKLTNKAHTKAKMDFDLSRFSDFTLKFPHKANAEDQLLNPGVFMVTLESDETIDCELTFAPTEVASYDFVIPVTINQTGAPSPSLTPMPPTPVPSQKNSLQHIINPRPVHITIATPRRKIVATALRQPLEISHHKLEFDLSPSTYALTSTSGIGQKKGTILVNNSDNHLQWCIDLDKGNQVLEDGVFKFLHPSGMPFLTYGDQGVGGSLVPGQTHHLGVIFCPNKPGYYNVTLPIVLENNFEEPYQYITIAGELKAPRLWFDPLAVVLTAVPLDTDVTAEITILAENYSSTAKIIAEVPEMDADDGSKLSPLKVVFPAGQEIKPCAGDDGHNEPSLLPCRITFRSSRPVSFSLPIKFMDDQGHSFQLPVTGTADNCLLTCYPFLAQHRTDHQIVCEQGTTLKGRKTLSQESLHLGEAVLVPCDEPPRCGSRPSTTATSSNFEVSSSSYEDSSQSYTGKTGDCEAHLDI